MSAHDAGLREALEQAIEHLDTYYFDDELPTPRKEGMLKILLAALAAPVPTPNEAGQREPRDLAQDAFFAGVVSDRTKPVHVAFDAWWPAHPAVSNACGCRWEGGRQVILCPACAAPVPTSMGISQSPETIADLAATYDDQPVPAWTGVHLCCGLLRFPGWINVDLIDLGQEVVADLAKPWTFLAPNSVERMYCKDGFEHQLDLTHFLREAARALKPGGTLEIWVPHYKNPSAYRLTHHHFFSWSCFAIYPEPHDEVQELTVKSVRLYLGWSTSWLWKPIHGLVNLAPKWWERVGYVSNIRVIFEKVAQS